MTQSRSRGQRRAGKSRRRPPQKAERPQRRGNTSQDTKPGTERKTVEAPSAPLGYKLDVLREDGRIVARKLEPIEPLSSQQFGALRRELRGWVQLAIPTPDEYSPWYKERDVASLKQAVWREILVCIHCGRELVDKKTGQGVLALVYASVFASILAGDLLHSHSRLVASASVALAHHASKTSDILPARELTETERAKPRR